MIKKWTDEKKRQVSRYISQLVATVSLLTVLKVSAQQPALVISHSIGEVPSKGDITSAAKISEHQTESHGSFSLRLSPELTIKASQSPERGARRTLSGQPQPLVVTITVNGEEKGEQIVYRASAQDFFLKLEEIKKFATVPPQTDIFDIEGEGFVPVNALNGSKVEFDEKTLGLSITLPPEAFPTTVYNLAKGPSTEGFQPGASGSKSALINYRLAYAGGTGAGRGILSLASEEAVSLGRWLIRNQSFHARDPQRTTSLRYITQLVRDNREDMQRLVIGDETTFAGDLGASVPIGGVSFSKAYQLSPYFVRQPSVNFAGAVALPSQVDFYVGNTRILRQQVSPGPFEIANFNYYGGQRDVRVVIRDMLGRERVISYPFYFADQGLALGLHDYSYHLGLLRENFGTASNEYGKLAFSAFQRYGFTDWLTVGARGEGTADYANAGPNIVLRSDRLGVVSVNAAASHDRRAGAQGFAYSAAHTFQGGEFSSQVAIRRFSRAYALLHAGPAPDLPEANFSVSMGYAPAGFGSLNIVYNQLKLRDKPESRTTTLSYSRALAGKFNLTGSYRRTVGNDSGYEVFFGLQYLPGPARNVSASLRRDDKNASSAQLQVSNSQPSGEGLAYRLSLDHNVSDTGTLNAVSPELQYSSRYATLSGEIRTLSGSVPSSTSYTLAVAGGIAAVGGQVGFSRPINDSFGLAEITPPLSGVRVYQNSQEVGRTAENGRLFLPTMTSFIENYISINDKDIPIEYAIEHVDRVVSPPYKSGSIVRFAVTRTQSIVGSLMYRVGGASKPLEYHLISMDIAGKKIDFPTGKNGDFYLENIAPGAYAASVPIGKTTCKFTFVIPKSDETFIKLSDLMTCDVAT